MVTIVFITAIGVLLPYLLHVHLKMPTEVQGNFTGNLVVIVELITIAIAIPVGIASDRWGRRPLYTIGFLMVFVGLVLLPLARTEETLVLYRLFSGAGLAIGTTILAATIADYPQNASRGKFISFNGVITGLGVILLSALLFGQLPKFFVARGTDEYEAGTYTFWAMAALALLTAFVTYAGLRAGRAVAHASRHFGELIRTGFAEVRKNRRLGLACAAYYVSRGDLTVFAMFFTLWLVAVGTDAGMMTSDAQSAASRLFGIAQLSMLLFTPVMGWMVDQLDRIVVLAISMGLAFVGYLALGTVDDPLNSPLMYGAAMLGGFGEAGVLVSGPALVGQEATPKARGSIIGFVSFFGAIGVVVNSKISGDLFDGWMYQGPFVFMAGMNLLVCLAAIALRAWEIRTGFVAHPTAAAAHRANTALEAARAIVREGPPGVTRPPCYRSPCGDSDAIQGLLPGHGAAPHRDPGRGQARLPEARAQVPPGRQQGAGCRDPVQGTGRGVRGAERSGEAGGLRPAGRRLESRPGLSAATGLERRIRVLRRRTGGSGRRFQRFLRDAVRARLRRHAPARGSFDIQGENRHARVLIDLEDAYAGATRTITLRIPELDGEGRMSMREHTLNVKIPRGILAGQQIRLAGQGGPGIGEGKAGDLYLEVEFRPHRWYRVEGRDVYLDLPVAPWEAALGASVKAPTPGGTVEFKIPPNSAAGRKLRLKGRGIPASPPGDLYVVLQIALPPADGEAARAIYARHGRAVPVLQPARGTGCVA